MRLSILAVVALLAACSREPAPVVVQPGVPAPQQTTQVQQVQPQAPQEQYQQPQAQYQQQPPQVIQAPPTVIVQQPPQVVQERDSGVGSFVAGAAIGALAGNALANSNNNNRNSYYAPPAAKSTTIVNNYGSAPANVYGQRAPAPAVPVPDKRVDVKPNVTAAVKQASPKTAAAPVPTSVPKPAAAPAAPSRPAARVKSK